MADALRCQLTEHAELNARLLEVHQKLDPQGRSATVQVDALMKMDRYSAILEKDSAPKSDELVSARIKAYDDCLRRARSRWPFCKECLQKQECSDAGGFQRLRRRSTTCLLTRT